MLQVGVGIFCKGKPSIAPMRSADIGCSYAEPAAVIPHRGQVSEYSSQSWVIKDAWDVFQEDDFGSYVANDADELRPESRLRSFDSGPLPCNAEVLARESANERIHFTAELSAAEGAHVGMHRCLGKAPFLHTRRQNSCGIYFPLDMTEAASFNAKVSAAGFEALPKHRDACEQINVGKCSHTVSRPHPQQLQLSARRFPLMQPPKAPLVFGHEPVERVH